MTLEKLLLTFTWSEVESISRHVVVAPQRRGGRTCSQAVCTECWTCSAAEREQLQHVCRADAETHSDLGGSSQPMRATGQQIQAAHVDSGTTEALKQEPPPRQNPSQRVTRWASRGAWACDTELLSFVQQPRAHPAQHPPFSPSTASSPSWGTEGLSHGH